MASSKAKPSSFSRISSTAPLSQIPGIKHGPNGTSFLSSGIPDLDKILGGGFLLGSIVMVMEDAEAPHHMLLLRNFMSQGLVHNQPLLYASPARDPRAFLGTLPSAVSAKDDKAHDRKPEQEKGLRIAWQYKKYFNDNQQDCNDSNHEYCSDLDLRKPLGRYFLTGQNIDCFSLPEFPDLSTFRDHCTKFLTQYARKDSNASSPVRIAIQSFCSPESEHSNMEWDMLYFLKDLRSKIRSLNAVAVITFPPSLLTQSSCKRWQHMADTLLSVKAVLDEDKELAKLLTGYQDMVGLLNVHKVARFNVQVPAILEATTYSINLKKRRFIILECLNQAPIDGSSGSSYGTSGSSCSGSSKTGTLDF